MKTKSYTDSLTLARRIRAAGCSIFIPEDDGEARCIHSDELRVYQTGSVIESTAFVWGCTTGFQINLVITSNKSMFAVSGVGLELPWKDDQLMWLEDPEELCGASRCYRFPGDRILEFERDHVINHRLHVTRPMSLGESVSGYLLGLGSAPIPEAFPHAKMIPAFVILYDQFGRAFRAGVKLWTDRHPHAPLRQGLEARKSKLFEKRDVIADTK